MVAMSLSDFAALCLYYLKSEERLLRSSFISGYNGYMSTILTYVPALAHTKQHHPENHARLSGLMPALEMFGILEEVTAVVPQLATYDQLRRVHTSGVIDYVRQISGQGGGLLDAGDTYATAESYDLARLAVGGCCTAVDKMMTGEAKNGFALVRPPGHHAESDRVSGFCLFNNIAAAARHAQIVHGVERILILDFDVHHGNGTQDIFYEDDSVMFASLHLYARYFYPGIGGMYEVGTRMGHGYTLNVPFPAGVGDVGYLRAMQEIIMPKARAFQPQLLLISAGFDAHWRDPLAMANLSLKGYGWLTQMLIELADELCNGRILFVLEGGYQLDVLTYGIINVFYSLLGRDEIYDPFGAAPEIEKDISPLLEQLKARYL